MARTAIDIVVTVKDGASAPLNNIQEKLRNTGKAAKDTSVDFTQFTKTLFTTAAFIGTFARGFSSMREAMNLGGDLDRLDNQFERVLGPKGALFSSLNQMTTTAISRMDAMKAALDLKQLGITGNIGETTAIIAKAGTAAKLAGLEAADGIKKFTDFLKDGSVAHLEALVLIKRTDPAFQALMATLNKAGGIYGTMLSTQEKLSIGMKLLDLRVRGQLKGARDLKDINILLNDSFSTLRHQLGRLIGRALVPLIEKLAPLVYHLGDVLDYIMKNEKHIVFFAKSILMITGALAGLIATLGTLKLIVKLLGFAGVGLPGLIVGILTLGSAFIGLTKDADSVMDKFRALGAVFKGIYELVTNFDPETGMSKLSNSTKELLKKYGLLGFVDTVSRIVVIIKAVVQDIVTVFRTLGRIIDDTFGGLFTKVFNGLEKLSYTWDTWWTSDAISGVEKFVRSATVILGGFLAVFSLKKLFSGFSGLMSKVPIVGKLFGGAGQPKGTKSDPMYVKNADGPAGINSGMSGIFSWLAAKLKKGILNLVTVFQITKYAAGPIRAFFTIIRAVGVVAAAIGVAIAAVAGIVDSILENSSKWETFFDGLADIITVAIADIPFIGIIFDVLKWVGEKLSTAFDLIFEAIDDITWVFIKIYEGWKNIFDWIAHFAEEIGVALSEKARKDRPDLFKEKIENQTGMSTNKAINALNVDMGDEAIANVIGTQMQSMSGAKAKEMQSLIEGALATRDANGRAITAEELDAYKRVYSQALREDENLKAMGDRAREGSVKGIKQQFRD